MQESLASTEASRPKIYSEPEIEKPGIFRTIITIILLGFFAFAMMRVFYFEFALGFILEYVESLTIAKLLIRYGVSLGLFFVSVFVTSALISLSVNAWNLILTRRSSVFYSILFSLFCVGIYIYFYPFSWDSIATLSAIISVFLASLLGLLLGNKISILLAKKAFVFFRIIAFIIFLACVGGTLYFYIGIPYFLVEDAEEIIENNLPREISNF